MVCSKSKLIKIFYNIMYCTSMIDRSRWIDFEKKFDLSLNTTEIFYSED